MTRVTINGEGYDFPQGTILVDAIKSIGLEVPTFCHDERLRSTSSCRICVVDVINGKGLVTSCSTEVAEGMEIETDNERVYASRRELLDLLFSNHPDDCLTCNKSGECKLQDYCYQYDIIDGSYREGEVKNYPIDDSNPFYTYDGSKCILCGNCVRTCADLQGTSAIGMQDRGFYSKVVAPFDLGIEQSTCVSCGNCVAVCPTGALMPKTRQKFRLWEVERTKTTCPYCAVGCQLNLLTKDGKVVGSEPYYRSEPNDGLLCVKGRFAYNFINHPDRLHSPLIKRNGVFEEASWDEALDYVAERLTAIKAEHGADAIGGFSCARATNEDNYVFQKFMRTAVGTNNVDHCARV